MNQYFKSNADMLVFALLHLDGENRQKVMGVTRAHYRNAELANNWRDSVAVEIAGMIPEAQTALLELGRMHSEMIG